MRGHALSNRQVVARGESVLRSLLRTPKSRRGLIAVVKAHGLTDNFVYGFLSEAERSGEVVKLRAGKVDTYQLSNHFFLEAPEPGIYPQWLDPRTLPAIRGRRVFFAGRPAEEQQQQNEAEDE